MGITLPFNYLDTKNGQINAISSHLYLFLYRLGYKQGETACQVKISHLVRTAANKSLGKRGKLPTITLL
jgi:hypothetical protein